MIAPHRSNRTKPTQDGRPLRRYRLRWKIERLFARLQNFRRLVTRYESLDNFTGMVSSRLRHDPAPPFMRWVLYS